MLVKIDRSTIRLNPDRNKTHIIVQGCVDMSFEYTGIQSEIPKILNQSDNVIWTEWCQWKIKGIINDPAIFDAIIEKGGYEGLSISIKNNLQMIPVGPQPEYLFNYENPDIMCEDCNKSYKLSELEDEFYFYICPHAHPIAKSIEFENINSIKK